MAAVVRPFTALHDAVEEVLRCAADHVDAVHDRSVEATERSYLALEAAVEAYARARAAHDSSVDCSNRPSLAVLAGGLSS